MMPGRGMAAEPPPSLSNQFFRKTRRGRVLHVVRERYLRDDVGYGVLSGGAAGGSAEVARVLDENQLVSALRDEYVDEASGKPVLLVLDTNVVVGQLTALESACPALGNLVLCETVLSETNKLKLVNKDRLRNLIASASRTCLVFPNEHHRDTYDGRKDGESANDHYDRLVRKAARFFAAKLKKQCKVILLTDDAGSLAKCREEEANEKSGLLAMKMVDFAQKVKSKYPRLIESVAGKSFQLTQNQALGALPAIFPGYLSQADVEEGIKKTKLFVGTLRTRSSRLCTEEDEGAVLVFGLGSNPEEGVRVTILGSLALNRAVEGDRVVVEIIPRPPGAATKQTEKKKPVEGEDEEDDEEDDVKVTEERFGRVVGIQKRLWRACVGTLVEDLSDLGLSDLELQRLASIDDGEDAERIVAFHPLDPKIPPMLVQTRRIAELKRERVVCQIDSWDIRSRLPSGHYVKSLGLIGEKDTETASVLFEHDIPTEEFSPAVMGCLPKEGKNWIPETPLPSWRVDLRNVDEVCSVDPPNCKDIDDALHCRLSPNNPDRLEVGVHIADVSHFVLPGTALDLEARRRGTSTYLVERRLDMLPGLLTTDICSLVGHKDRYTFSVIWETTLDGKKFVGEPRFFKSVIRSRGALTYDQAQAMILDNKADSTTSESIRRLNMIAKNLRANRIANGALTLASQEVRFELDEETQDPTSVRKYVQKDAHHMVEEFMLLANCAVAEKIERSYPRKALLRKHPKPSREMLEELVISGRAAGVKLDVSSSKALADSLDAAQRPDQPAFNQILRIATTRSMQQAKYFCTGFEEAREAFSHYGLAVPVYTHFTSPIRRYADLVVHRMLGAAIGLQPLYEGYDRREDVKAVSDNLNRRHRNAQKAGRASSAVHTIVLFRSRPPADVDAFISGVSALRVNVIVPEFGLEEVLSNAEGDFDPKTMSVVLQPSGRRLTVFDKVRVRIYVETIGAAQRQRLVVELLEDGPPSANSKRAAASSEQNVKRAKQTEEQPAPASARKTSNPKRQKQGK